MDAQNSKNGLTFPFDVNGAGADRLRLAVKGKLKEFLEIYTDDVLAEYVVVLVGHGKQQAQATADLEAFLGDQTEPFVHWLWGHLTANKQLYVTDASSVDTTKSGPGKEKHLPVKLHTEVNSALHSVGLEDTRRKKFTSDMIHNEKTLSGKVLDKEVHYEFMNSLKHSASSSQGVKEMDRQDEITFANLKVRGMQSNDTQVREQKRQRTFEPWSQRARCRMDDKENSKKEPTPLLIRGSRRLLESAVRDAVAPVVSGPRKNDSKRLRSVVSAETDHRESLEEPINKQHQLRPRATFFKHGAKMSPTVIVALKAAAAAAEDVNSHTRKSRARFLSNVWDRLGTTRNGHAILHKTVELADTEDDLKVIEQAQSNEDMSEVEEGMISDGSDNRSARDEHEWQYVKCSSRATPEEDTSLLEDDGGPLDDETMLFEEVGCASFDALHVEGDSFERQTLPEIVRHDYDEDVEVHEPADGEYSEAITEAVHVIDRYNISSYITEDTQHRSHDTSAALQPEHAELDVLEKMSQDSEKVISNENLSTLKNANTAVCSAIQAETDAQKDNKLLRIDDAEQPDIDVSEMRKRMRQVELEMTKLRARQAEVTKEVQKVTAPPMQPNVKALQSAEDDIDARSVFVTNVHFAAAKDMISSHFANCGDVVRVTILTDGATGMPKGSAYVEFSSKDGVEKALKLNESNLLSRTLKVVRKDVAFPEINPLIRSPLLHPLRLAARPIVRSTFFRRPPILMRPSRLLRPFPGGQRLQWKRETPILGPHGYPVTAFLDSSSSLLPSVNPYRAMGAPIRKRSLSYVRGTSGTPCESTVNVQEQKAG